MLAVKFIALVVALALGLTATAHAQGPNASFIEITLPWARATPGGSRTGAAYVTIVNKGTTDDRLIAISTPIAKTAEIHKTENDNGVMKMTQVSGVDVKVGEEMVFAPGGYHIMLTDLKAPLKEGQTLPMTFIFQKAGELKVTVKVAKAGAIGPTP